MSRDSQRSLADPLFQPSARADSQMRRSPPIPFGLRAVHSNARLVLERREAIDLGVGVNWGFRAGTEIPLCEPSRLQIIWISPYRRPVTESPDTAKASGNSP